MRHPIEELEGREEEEEEREEEAAAAAAEEEEELTRGPPLGQRWAPCCDRALVRRESSRRDAAAQDGGRGTPLS